MGNKISLLVFFFLITPILAQDFVVKNLNTGEELAFPNMLIVPEDRGNLTDDKYVICSISYDNELIGFYRCNDLRINETTIPEPIEEKKSYIGILLVVLFSVIIISLILVALIKRRSQIQLVNFETHSNQKIA